jgi:hypothetical protein
MVFLLLGANGELIAFHPEEGKILFDDGSKKEATVEEMRELYRKLVKEGSC